MISVPNLIIVELFRRTKRKHEKRLIGLSGFLKNFNQETCIRSNKRNEKYVVDNQPNLKPIKIKKKFKFPWWFKIIIYIICLIISGVSLFFIIVKGIEFGNEKVEKWVTSLFLSFLMSIFLTQPVKMIFLTFLLVVLFKSFNDEEDVEESNLDFNKENAENKVGYILVLKT